MQAFGFCAGLLLGICISWVGGHWAPHRMTWESCIPSHILCFQPSLGCLPLTVQCEWLLCCAYVVGEIAFSMCFRPWLIAPMPETAFCCISIWSQFQSLTKLKTHNMSVCASRSHIMGTHLENTCPSFDLVSCWVCSTWWRTTGFTQRLLLSSVSSRARPPHRLLSRTFLNKWHTYVFIWALETFDLGQWKTYTTVLFFLGKLENLNNFCFSFTSQLAQCLSPKRCSQRYLNEQCIWYYSYRIVYNELLNILIVF